MNCQNMITRLKIEQLIINSISLIPPHGLLCIFLLEDNRPMIEFHYLQDLVVHTSIPGKRGIQKNNFLIPPQKLTLWVLLPLVMLNK